MLTKIGPRSLQTLLDMELLVGEREDHVSRAVRAAVAHLEESQGKGLLGDEMEDKAFQVGPVKWR